MALLTGHRYGFIKYYSLAAAEKFIRGFHSQGYVAKLVQVTLLAQKKKLSTYTIST